jgi:hypothetical protein
MKLTPIVGLPMTTLGILAPLALSAHAQNADSIPGLTIPDGWRSERSGSDVVLFPSAVSKDTFRMEIKPLKSLGGSSLRDWLSGQIAADAPQQGKTLHETPVKAASGANLMVGARVVQDSAGMQRIVTYAAIGGSGEQARLVQITMPANKKPYEEHWQTAIRLTSGLVRGAGAYTKRETTSRSDDTPRRSSSRTPRKPKPEYRTKPGAGIKPSQIEGVYMVQSYQMGVGGYMYLTYEPVLFLKDGTYCENMSVPPADLDVAASRKGEPNQWGRWKRVGSQFQMQDSKGKWDDPEKLIEAKPGKPGEKLRGTFSNFTGGGNTAFGGGTMVAVSSSYTFAPDGTFKSGRSVGASSAEPMSDSSVTVSSKSSNEGTYTIDGYTLTLRYSNGVVERRSFAFMDAKEKDAIYINSSAYLNRK